MTYVRRKERMTALLSWVGTVLICLAAAILFSSVYELLPTSLQDSMLKYIAKASPKWVSDFLGNSALVGVGLFAGLAVFRPSWASRNSIGEILYARFFDVLNYDLFERIDETSPEVATHSAMPWVAPGSCHTGTVRETLWRAILDWISSGAEQFAPKNIPFSWSVITGHAGVGKSRIVLEAAQELGWRRSGQRGLRVRIRTLNRRLRTAIFSHRALSDPWDVAMILRSPSFGSINSLSGSAQFRQMLQAWRPCAPTLLVLDDPSPDEAKLLVNILSESITKGSAKSSIFHRTFPIRLLIVSDCVPADLEISPKALRVGVWESRLEGFSGSVWNMTRDHYLTAREVSTLFRLIFPLADDPRRWLVASSEVAFRISDEGHPAILEALQAWLRGIGDRRNVDLHAFRFFDTMQARCQRLVGSLVASGVVQHREFCTLASAILADGIPLGGQSKSSGSDIGQGALRRIFPNDKKLDVRIPAMRPKSVGYWFVTWVLQLPNELGHGWSASEQGRRATATDIVSRAWEANALATIGAVAYMQRLRGTVGELPAAEVDLLSEALDELLASKVDTTVGEWANTIVQFFLRTGMFRHAVAKMLSSANMEQCLDIMSKAHNSVVQYGPWPETAVCPLRNSISLFCMGLHEVATRQSIGESHASRVLTTVYDLCESLVFFRGIYIEASDEDTSAFALIADVIDQHIHSNDEVLRAIEYIRLLQGIWFSPPLREGFCKIVARSIASHALRKEIEGINLSRLVAESQLMAHEPNISEILRICDQLKVARNAAVQDGRVELILAWCASILVVGSAAMGEKQLVLSCVRLVEESYARHDSIPEALGLNIPAIHIAALARSMQVGDYSAKCEVDAGKLMSRVLELNAEASSIQADRVAHFADWTCGTHHWSIERRLAAGELDSALEELRSLVRFISLHRTLSWRDRYEPNQWVSHACLAVYRHAYDNGKVEVLRKVSALFEGVRRGIIFDNPRLGSAIAVPYLAYLNLQAAHGIYTLNARLSVRSVMRASRFEHRYLCLPAADRFKFDCVLSAIWANSVLASFEAGDMATADHGAAKVEALFRTHRPVPSPVGVPLVVSMCFVLAYRCHALVAAIQLHEVADTLDRVRSLVRLWSEFADLESKTELNAAMAFALRSQAGRYTDTNDIESLFAVRKFIQSSVDSGGAAPISCLASSLCSLSILDSAIAKVFANLHRYEEAIQFASKVEERLASLKARGFIRDIHFEEPLFSAKTTLTYVFANRRQIEDLQSTLQSMKNRLVDLLGLPHWLRSKLMISLLTAQKNAIEAYLIQKRFDLAVSEMDYCENLIKDVIGDADQRFSEFKRKCDQARLLITAAAAQELGESDSKLVKLVLEGGRVVELGRDAFRAHSPVSSVLI